MFGGFDRELYLSFIIQLAEAQYDNISNLMKLTVQELSDVHKVIVGIQQEREIERSRRGKG